MKPTVILTVLATLGCASRQPEPAVENALPPGFELPEPHEFLRRFVGTWVVESDVPSGDEDVRMEGTAVARAVGSWVMTEGTVPMGDVTLTAVFTIGYEPQRDRFVGIWFDSTLPLLRVYEGQLDEAGEVLTLECPGPSRAGEDVEVHFRERLSFVGEGRRLHESFVSTDGTTWTQTVEARSRRK